MLAAHGFATLFSEDWLCLAAKTLLALDIHHLWGLALLATHGVATVFSEVWLGPSAKTQLVHDIHHF